ncbi:unnamed protein product, partial [Effrenium voratum]
MSCTRHSGFKVDHASCREILSHRRIKMLELKMLELKMLELMQHQRSWRVPYR